MRCANFLAKSKKQEATVAEPFQEIAAVHTSAVRRFLGNMEPLKGEGDRCQYTLVAA